MKKPSSKITAKELLKKLANDPKHVAMMKVKEKDLKKKRESFEIEEKKLIKDLANVGCKVSSVYDLVNTKKKYPEAIPVLLKHLPINYSDITKEGIIHALTIKEAKGVMTESLLNKELAKAIKKNHPYLIPSLKNALSYQL